MMYKVSRISIILLLLSFALRVLTFAQQEKKVVVRNSLPTVAQVLEKYVNAIGGREANRRVKSLILKGKIEMSPVGIKGEYEKFSLAPNKSFTRIKLEGFGELIEVFDGQRAWVVDPIKGKREKKGGELIQTAIESFLYKSIELDKLYKDLRVRGIEKVGDRDAYVVAGKLTEEAETELFYFDVQTGFLIKTESVLIIPEGKLKSVTYIDDMREVAGVKLPYRITTELPQLKVIITVSSIDVNPKIDESLFKEPQ